MQSPVVSAKVKEGLRKAQGLRLELLDLGPVLLDLVLLPAELVQVALVQGDDCGTSRRLARSRDWSSVIACDWRCCSPISRCVLAHSQDGRADVPLLGDVLESVVMLHAPEGLGPEVRREVERALAAREAGRGRGRG